MCPFCGIDLSAHANHDVFACGKHWQENAPESDEQFARSDETPSVVRIASTAPCPFYRLHNDRTRCDLCHDVGTVSLEVLSATYAAWRRTHHDSHRTEQITDVRDEGRTRASSIAQRMLPPFEAWSLPKALKLSRFLNPDRQAIVTNSSDPLVIYLVFSYPGQGDKYRLFSHHKHGKIHLPIDYEASQDRVFTLSSMPKPLQRCYECSPLAAIQNYLKCHGQDDLFDHWLPTRVLTKVFS